MSRKKIKLSKIDLEYVDGADEAENLDDSAENDEKTVDLSPVNFTVTFELEFWEKIWKIEQDLSAALTKIDFKIDKNISAIYNPLEYASNVHTNYMRKYLKKAPDLLFLGMNPGLYGMCQTSASGSLFQMRYHFFTSDSAFRSHSATSLL